MEKAVISYGKGLTTSPSDLICSDGELAECVNLEVKNEELVPMEMPARLGVSLESGERLVLVHNIKTGGKNYFTISPTGILSAFHVVDGAKVSYDLSLYCGEITSIQSIGNTVVVYTPESPNYILYKGGKYVYLGTSIPEIGISFNLSGTFEVGETFELTTPDSSKDSEEYQEEVVPTLISQVNSFISGKATANNMFMFPFFVRYAIRLFDGTCVHHSAPILLCPSTFLNPYCVCIRGIRDTDMRNRTYRCQIGGMVSSLEYNVLRSGSELSNWSDIISGIDVCVSRQIYTYDQNGTKFGDLSGSVLSAFVGKYNGSNSIWNIHSILERESTLQPGDQEYLSNFPLPTRTLDEVYNDIVSTSLFYQYSFIETSDLYVGRSSSLTGALNSLEVENTLVDDYMTHDHLIPKSTFVYNGRLNISNITRKLFDGFSVDTMSSLIEERPSEGYDYGEIQYEQYYAYVYIRNSNGEDDIIVKSPLSTFGGLYSPFIFYPDTDAYKMVITNSTGTLASYIMLSEHTGLNGSYAFKGFMPTLFVSTSDKINTTDNVDIMSNKLFVSSVNNPFHFPLEGIYTVGTDRIIGMGAITRPISQGQFGEFPLIVFCSDGNYAMRVDEQGFYASISPVQEDLVLGSDKITSMENSLVVITKKGIMLTAGGEMNKVASQMDGAMIMASSLSGIGTSVSDLSNLVSKSSDDMGFLSYVYGSRMAFDYASNRLLVYNPEKTYSYVYDFNNDTISKLVINGGRKIVASVLDYPDTIIQDDSGAMYSLYTKDDISTKTGRQYGFALTRPLKMGAALNLKSVKQVMHLTSNCGNGSYVKYILYGSNDNATYYRVSSRFGKPYKYYRIAIYTHLLPKESLSGSAITTEERRTHKLR